MRNNSKNLFWISFSDIMTSLFFIMLVLFVVITFFFNFKVNQLESEVTVLEEEREEVLSIQNATQSLDQRFFAFDDQNKRYRLNLDVNFAPNSSDLSTIGPTALNELLEAGRNLYSTVDDILNNFDDAYLILLIEGNTQKVCRGPLGNDCNYINAPDRGYRLSYERALALLNFWKDNGLDFYSFGQRCEVIISGSGYFGLSREDNEFLNRRFTLQLTPKWTLESSRIGGR